MLYLEGLSWIAATSPFEDLVHLVEINNKKEKQINSSLFEDQIPFEDLVHLVNIWRIWTANSSYLCGFHMDGVDIFPTAFYSLEKWW